MELFTQHCPFGRSVTRLCIAFLFCLMLTVTRPCLAGDLYAEFQQPPRDYAPVPFWFWNAELDRAEIEWQIDQMIEQHVYGAFMHARTGLLTPYFSESWWQAVESAVEHGKRKGFKTWIYDEYNWPSGQANGRVTDGHPEFLPRNIEMTSTPVTGPMRYTAELDSDGAVALLVAEMEGAGLAPKPATVIPDVLAGGPVQWEYDVPPGAHMIMLVREVMQDRYVDLLNRRAVERFVNLTHREYRRRFGRHFGKTIPGTFTDEPNIRSFFNPAWTVDFLTHFQRMKGYDLRPFLGALFHDSGDLSVKTRCDYYDVLTSLYEQSFWRQIGEWSAGHGLVSTGHLKPEESITGHMRLAGDAMRALRHLHITGIDCVTGPRRLEVEAMKLGSSVAHLYERDRILSETFAGCGHALSFVEMKWMSDWQFAGGVNMLVPHAFHYSIEGPGPERRNDWPPTMFYQQPYWPHYALFADYAARISRVLSGGVHVADIAVHYPIKTMWAGSGPVGTDDEYCAETYSDVLNHLFARNLDFDLLDDDSLERSEIADGRLHVGRLTFGAVVLPATRVLTRAGAAKLAAFEATGGLVVCVGRKPTASPEYGGSDPRVTELMAETKSADTVTQAERILRSALLPDVEVVRGKHLYHNHVRHQTHDIYFVSSQLDRSQETVLRLRCEGYPELWDADTGEAFLLDVEREGQYARIALELAAYGSAIIAFSETPDANQRVAGYSSITEIDLPDTWQFEARPHTYRNEKPPDGCDARPDHPKAVAPGDWCDIGLETFSGTGIYRTKVTLPKLTSRQRVLLDLGEARVVASVYLNDRLAGRRAWYPFEFDLTDLARTGENALRVEVTNTIANRMTLRSTGKWDASPRERLASGMLGPVRLGVLRPD